MSADGKKGKWTQAEEAAFKELTEQRAASRQQLAALVRKVVSKAFNVDTLVERFIECAHEIRDALEPFDTRGPK